MVVSRYRHRCRCRCRYIYIYIYIDIAIKKLLKFQSTKQKCKAVSSVWEFSIENMGIYFHSRIENNRILALHGQIIRTNYILPKRQICMGIKWLSPCMHCLVYLGFRINVFTWQ